MSRSQAGAFKPVWVVVAVLTCILFGSTVNRCLTCGRPFDGGPSGIDEGPVVQGALLVAPALKGGGAAVEAAEPEAPPEPEEDEEGEYLAVTFDKLASFVYEYPEQNQRRPFEEIFPLSIRNLKGKKVAVRGFMLPITVDGENVSEFLLVRNQFACCFGIMPRMNEWVHVHMAEGKKAPYVMDIHITVFGGLDVGELWRDGGVESLYRMTADDIAEPPTFR